MLGPELISGPGLAARVLPLVTGPALGLLRAPSYEGRGQLSCRETESQHECCPATQGTGIQQFLHENSRSHAPATALTRPHSTSAWTCQPSSSRLRSQLLGSSLAWHPTGLHQSRGCRWLAQVDERQMMDIKMPGLMARLPDATPVDAPERGIGVRMESQVIFDSCWRRFEERYKLQNVHVPREVVWLNGAPGSGKGVNTLHILKTRGLDTSVSMSSMLMSHPEVKSLIDRGEMLPDTLVGDLLLEALLIKCCQAPDCGVLVDGFPRTAVQVDFVKLLYDKFQSLNQVFAGTPHDSQFPRPLFKVVMLYVDEETSIKRQMARAKQAFMHNKRVMDAGAGELWEQRATDMSVEKCKKRYDIFKTHYGATMRLKEFFPFHLIDSMGALEETQEAISLELRYQSSLDLSAATYSHLRHLPLSRDLAQHARQQLVSRLNDHSQKHPHLFQKVIDIITVEVMPMLKESGMAGRVEYVADMRLFTDHPRAAQMLIDVLTDRGFSASHSTEVTYVPISIDMATGAIKNRKDTRHRFTIAWETKGVRDIAKAIDIAMRMAESTHGDAAADVGGPRISQSFIPSEPKPPKGSPLLHMPSRRMGRSQCSDSEEGPMVQAAHGG